MPDSAQSNNWDFTLVHDLLSSLREQDAASTTPVAAFRRDDERSSNPIAADSGSSLVNQTSPQSDALGNFSKLWEYLGVHSSAVETSVPPFEASIAAQKQDTPFYASDGAIYYPPSAKNVRWRDEQIEEADLADTQPDSPPSGERLTKNQRKKRNRKARKEADKLLSDKPSNAADSGDDTDHTLTPSKPPRVPSKSISGSHDGTTEHLASSLRPAQVVPPKAAVESDQAPAPKAASGGKNGQTQSKTSTPIRHAHRFSQDLPATNLPSIVPGVPFSDPKPPRHSALVQLPSSAVASVQQQTPTRSRREIKPLEMQDSDDRNWSLLLKLIRNFPGDRKPLLSPLQLSINRPQPNGIHVFIDASNILIGYYQHQRRVRGIPEDARVPRVYPSFHALALLLERRRPVAKRVLVGSSPRVSAYDEAQQVGYETCILDKVFKTKELTDRQRRFARQNASGKRNGYSSGYESSDTNNNNAALSSPQPKWVEQAVDELLHLKMAESLMDVDAPVASDDAPNVARPIMVLATGDAAEAEYSGGFLKMVDRALNKGWNVEVAAWGVGISQEYRNLQRKGKWAGRFKVIELDQYAEQLFPADD